MKIALVDIGGTAVKTALFTEGMLTDIIEVPTSITTDGNMIMDQVVKLLKNYNDFERIGVASAGQIDSRNGVVKYANPNIPGYTGTDIRGVLQKEFNVPVAVENDVNAALIGELHFGAGLGESDFICLTYGTGIGGAIFLGENLYSGREFSAGEFGCIITHGSKRTAKDIMSGTYERYASTTALVKEAIKYDSRLNSGRKIVKKMDNPLVSSIVNRWMDEIVLGLISLVHIFNPSLIIMGGGIMQQKNIVSKIEEKLTKQVMSSFKVRLVPAKLGNNAGILGALYLAENL